MRLVIPPLLLVVALAASCPGGVDYPTESPVTDGTNPGLPNQLTMDPSTATVDVGATQTFVASLAYCGCLTGAATPMTFTVGQWSVRDTSIVEIVSSTRPTATSSTQVTVVRAKKPGSTVVDVREPRSGLTAHSAITVR